MLCSFVVGTFETVQRQRGTINWRSCEFSRPALTKTFLRWKRITL